MAANHPIADAKVIPHSALVLMTWFLIFLSPVGGYLLGRMRPGNWRLSLLLLFVAAPPLAFTAWIASARAAPEGFFVWWWIGMGFIFLPEIVWAIGAFVGFSVGKRKVG